MTSGNFERIFIEQIIIHREDRQRRELRNIDELAQSIKSIGLIHPPVVTRTLHLVAGERRLEACRSLGWLEIPIQYADTLDPLDLQLLELEENVKRLDLTWQEHNDTIAKYHSLRATIKPDWSPVDTGRELGMNDSQVRKHLLVAKARAEEVAGVGDAAALSVAIGLSQRNNERKRVEVLRELPPPVVFATPAVNESVPVITPPPPKRLELLNMSFLDWLQNPTGKFNLIHCDFPYGVSIGDKSGQSAAKLTGMYEDTKEIYFELLTAFVLNTPKFVEDSAHLMFWFSMNYFEQTKAALQDGGWSVNPFPLIWLKSDNAGILPDKDRGPRRVYETALLASRGDRKIVRPVANGFSHPTTRELHTSEKPLPVLDHFFRMLVDDSTTLLDPTAGSANAIVAAHNKGAAYSLGIEMSPDFFKDAKEHHGL